ncbi:MAG: tetratricopeptide repeat protein [Verrucomicrobiota bacterium]
MLGLIVTVAGVWVPASNLRERLPRSQAAVLRRWLRLWAIKGWAAPVLLWLIFNTSFSDSFPPLMAQIQAAPRGLATVAAFLEVAGIGFCVIASYWAAVTLGWLLRVLEAQALDRLQFRRTVLELSVFLVPLAVLIVCAFGVESAGVAGVVWLGPIVQTVIPLVFRERTAPLYTRAIIKMLGDKHREAELAVIEELEQWEDDFNGWLMLAELYANHFDDLAGADRVIRDTCAQASTSASEVCVAFNRLADWHLNLADDPVAAREALEEICRRFPETHMGRMARQRINQLPASREELIAQRTPKPIRLPALGSTLDHPAGVPASRSERREAADRANECVQKLQKNPDDMAVREELARILAERLDKAGAAIEQIELLLNMPEASASQAARWMGLVAAWQIKYQGDVQKGRETMERLVRLYPQSTEAFGAQRRLALMELEAKIRAARSAANPAREKPISLSLSF